MRHCTRHGRSRARLRGSSSPLLESVLLPFIEQVRLRATQVDDLGTSVPVLLLHGALLAVVGVGDAGAAADNAAPLVAPVVALVADTHQRAWAHVGVANDAATVALLTKATDGHAGLLAAEDQVGVVLGHDDEGLFTSKNRCGSRRQRREPAKATLVIYAI